MRGLETALRILSIAGIVAASVGFVVVLLLPRLGDDLTAALLLLCLAEIGRDVLVLRYLRRARMEIRRREMELVQPTQWYSDRR